jgi:hypothetical protein
MNMMESARNMEIHEYMNMDERWESGITGARGFRIHHYHSN